jgi:AcrR family transcriptional regulator
VSIGAFTIDLSAVFGLVFTDMNVTVDQPRRPYDMARRAAAATQTGERIVQATIELHAERWPDQVSLEDIAARAGVTVQTILRRFHSKEALVDAAADAAAEQVVQQRRQARPGDVHGAVEVLLDHYEQWGRISLRLLAQEDRVPHLRRITDRGRELHAQWVRETFRPFLTGDGPTEPLESQLVAITDVYVWKVLHLDRGLDRATTAVAMVGMVEALVRKEEPDA